VRGAVALFTAQPLTWAASLLTAILVPRYLGDQALGQYIVAVTIANLAGLVASLGVPNYLRRHIATQPTRAAVDSAAAFVVLVTLALLIASALAAALPFLGFPAGEISLVLVALIGMVVTTAQTLALSVLVGQERHGRYAWLNAAVAVAGAVAGIGVLLVGGGVQAYLATGVAASAAVAVLAWRAAGLKICRPALDLGLWQRLARSGFPFLGWMLALQIYGEIDKLLLAMLANEAVVGWYAAAYRIISIPVFIPTLITTPLLPALSRHAADRALFQQTVRRSLFAVLVLTVPTSAMSIGLAPAVPDLLHWPSAFQNSVPLMMILALHLPIVAVDMVLGTALTALHRERYWFGIGAVASVVNPALNLLLIPYFEHSLNNGAIGAAIVTVATELLMLGGALMLVPRGLVDRSLVGLSGRVVVAGVCLAVVTAQLLPLSLLLAVAGGGLAFVGVAAALHVLRPVDFRIIHHAALQALARR